MSRRLYRVVEELHWRTPDGKIHSLVVWYQIGGDRTRYHLAIDGTVTEYEDAGPRNSTADGAADAARALAYDTPGSEVIDDATARADITARCGIIPESCLLADCGARIPIGASRCEENHRISRQGDHVKWVAPR